MSGTGARRRCDFNDVCIIRLLDGTPFVINPRVDQMLNERQARMTSPRLRSVLALV